MLRVERLSRAFQTLSGPVQALQEATFSVPEGVIAGLLGPNGSGKTTLMRLMMGILPPDEGQVTLHDQSLSGLDRRRIGYMPEERGLYPKAPVYEQLLYLLRLRGFSPEEAEREIQTWSKRLSILSYIQRPAKTLSKGMQQKAQLLLALAGSPQFLLLDEPFSGLDPINAQDVEALLRTLRQHGRLILLSTHRLEQVDHLCDYIVLIHRGRILLTGYTDQLRRARWDHRYLIETALPIQTLSWPEDLTLTHLSTHSAEVVLPPSLSSQAFLRHLADQTPIRTFQEKLPTVKDIFLQTVQNQPV